MARDVFLSVDHTTNEANMKHPRTSISIVGSKGSQGKYLFTEGLSVYNKSNAPRHNDTSLCLLLLPFDAKRVRNGKNKI